MREIIGKERPLIDLLANKKYTIHYYQREYRWGKKQVEELIDDLTDEFLEHYDDQHERNEVEHYGHYYLGSIVLSSNKEGNAIIDGQQRLTSLTLLLIYLNNLQDGRKDKVDIDRLIFSEQYAKKSFNIQVEERESCLNALYTAQSFDPNDQPESIRNIYERNQDITKLFPEELKGKPLPYFIEWLIYKVFLVEISAHTEQDAHKIFVSMNDRGLSLTPTEMLKGFLLSEIKDDSTRSKANDLWKEKILQLKDIGKDEDPDFLKNWLRAQFADSIRETKKGAINEDWDIIGTTFHKWVKENARKIELQRSTDYERFVLHDFATFSDIYSELKTYSSVFHPDRQYVYYNANRNFTLQYQVILAAVSPNDDPETIDRKIRAVSCFLDQYIAARVFNFRVVDYSTIKNPMFALTKKIRRKPIEELKDLLYQEITTLSIDGNPLNLENIDRFHLNQFTGRYMLHILARLTHYIEEGAGLNTRFEDYVNRETKNPFDIEHIIADHFERFQNEFRDEEEFQTFRNRFGALLILPRDKNRSYQDATYEQKLPLYFGENLLARSLNEKCYQNNPQFLRFIQETRLPFKPHSTFKQEQVRERQELYKALAKRIWDPEKIKAF